MKILFHDTGEVYEIDGERPQFWLFHFPDGRLGKAVKGNPNHKLIMPMEEMMQNHFGLQIPDEEITIRSELSSFPEESSDEEF